MKISNSASIFEQLWAPAVPLRHTLNRACELHRLVTGRYPLTQGHARRTRTRARLVMCLSNDEDQVIRLIAHRPRVDTEAAFDEIDHRVRHRYGSSPAERIYFLAVLRGDASQFEDTLRVTGQSTGP